MNKSIATRLPSLRIARAIRSVALLGLMALLFSASPAAAADWRVSGQVRYSAGGAVAGATVRLRLPDGAEVSTTSDANGGYTLWASSSSVGTAIVWAEVTGGSSQQEQVMDHDVTQHLTIPGSGN